VVLLHDDYLLPRAGEAMIQVIGRPGSSEGMLLFGVQIVDLDGRRRREQRFRRERCLEPKQALRRLLRNSSFVRRCEKEGLFDISVGGADDTNVWVRIFSRSGLPQATCAYTIHEAAATTACGTPAPSVPKATSSTGPWRGGRRRANHQTLAGRLVPPVGLAGAYRRLRLGRRAEAREVLRLFDLRDVGELGLSPRWLPVRAAFRAAT
jgi:hypothetical protein